MNRRAGIRTLLMISAGAALLPSCMQGEQRPSIPVKNLKLTESDEELLAAMADTILPDGNTPGAKSLGAHAFVIMMMDDCYPPAEQQQFMAGLASFNRLALQHGDQPFSKADAVARARIMSVLDKESDDRDLLFFFTQVRKLTIRAFTQSKYYLTEVKRYVIVPGKYYGCVPLNEAS